MSPDDRPTIPADAASDFPVAPHEFWSEDDEWGRAYPDEMAPEPAETLKSDFLGDGDDGWYELILHYWTPGRHGFPWKEGVGDDPLYERTMRAMTPTDDEGPR
jgi:hypothetical protein